MLFGKIILLFTSSKNKLSFTTNTTKAADIFKGKIIERSIFPTFKERFRSLTPVNS